MLDPDADRCLDEDTVARLLERQLDPAEQDRVRAHLDACAECLQWVAKASFLVVVDDTPFDGPARWAGRYAVRGTLGRGGMGVVYLAWDEVLEREVALKVLRHDLVRRLRQGRERLVAESKAMAQLKHPNVVTVYDVVSDGEDVFVAMEYVAGTTMRQWLAQSTRPWKAIARCLLDAGQGLAAAHDAGMVHRDFKPDNVLIDKHGRAKVTDFGLARVLDEPPDGETAAPAGTGSARGVTSVGQRVGTPAYMPPEQLRSGRVDARADIFAFCVTAFEAWFGRRPFPDAPVDLRIEAIERGRTTSLGRTEVPRAVRKAFGQGLAYDRDLRPTSMAPLLRTLSRSLARRRRYAVLIAFVAGLGAAGLGWLSRAPPCEPPSDRLRDAWSAPGAARVERALADGAGLEGELLWTRLQLQVDGLIAGLDSAHVAACESARDRKSAARGRTELECLSEHRLTLATLLELAADGDVNAPRKVDALKPPAWCEARANEATSPSPADPETVAPLQDSIAQLEALALAKRWPEVEDHATTLIAEARAHELPSLEARALVLSAGAVVDEDVDLAISRCVSAAEIGRRLGAHTLTAEAWTEAARFTYERKDDMAAVRRYLEQAWVAIEQIGVPTVKARLSVLPITMAGTQAIEQEKYDEAAAHIEQAQTLARTHATFLLPNLLLLDAGLWWGQGDLERALEISERLLRWDEAQWGANSKSVVGDLQMLADLHLARSRPEDARPAVVRALKIVDQHTPRDDVRAADVRAGAAWVFLALGEFEKAIDLADECARIRGDAMTAYEDAQLERTRGAAKLGLGDPRAAVQHFERARALKTPIESPDPTATLDVTIELAEALGRAGDGATALSIAEKALPRIEAGKPGSQDAALARMTVGWLQIDQGKPTIQTRFLFERAAAAATKPHDRAWATFGQAVVADALEGRTLETMRLARSAQEIFARHPERHPYEFDKVRAFLSAAEAQP